jgi:hypothetical protein
MKLLCLRLPTAGPRCSIVDIGTAWSSDEDPGLGGRRKTASSRVAGGTNTTVACSQVAY